MNSMGGHSISRGLQLATCFLLALVTLVGCDSKPKVVPVSGRVTYRGKPLEFGSVMFQPSSGQPAIGDIQPDGTFQLTTFQPNDGAVIGSHMVRIACFENQKTIQHGAAGEQPLGKLLIPQRYTLLGQSGLTAEVVDGENPPFVFDLTD